MKRKQWMKGKRLISLVLACLLVISIIPWSDLIVRAEEEYFSIAVKEQGGSGSISGISIVAPQVTPEDGSLADGKISQIPAGAKVSFELTPTEGKYLEKIICKKAAGNVTLDDGNVTPGEGSITPGDGNVTPGDGDVGGDVGEGAVIDGGVTVEQDGSGVYKVTVGAVKENLILVCIYGDVKSQAGGKEYFSVKAKGSNPQEDMETYPVFGESAEGIEDGIYYAKRGFLLYPQEGVSLKMEGEEAYDSAKREYAEDREISSLYVEQAAGDSSSYQKVSLQPKVSLRIDNEAPSINEITFSGLGESESSWSKDSVVETAYGYYFQDATAMHIRAEDDASGVSALTCRLEGIDGTKKEVVIAKQGDQGYILEIASNFKGRVFVTATDHVGNRSEEAQPAGVIVEDKDKHEGNSEITIELPDTAYRDAKGQNLYQGQIQAKVTVKDAYMGLKKVSWSLAAGAGEKTKETLMEDSVEIDNAGNFPEGTGFQGVKEDNLVTEMTGEIAIDSNRNDLTLTVSLTDRANRPLQEEVTFSIDSTPPKVTVAYEDGASPDTTADGSKNGIYKNTRNAYITVQERNFNGEEESIAISKALEEAGVTVSEWENADGLSGSSDEAAHTCKVTFPGDSAYRFSMQVKDLAGNQASYREDGSADVFTVDQAAPTLSADVAVVPKDPQTVKQYVQTGSEAVTWYNQDVKFSFTAKDAVSGLYQVKTSDAEGVDGKLANHVDETYDLAPYSVDGSDYGKRSEVLEREYTQVETAGEGTYRLKAQAIDYAGGEERLASGKVGVDTTAPEVTGITFCATETSQEDWKNDSVVQTPYGYYFKEAATVKVYAQDALSGLKSISYCLQDVENSGERAYQALTPQKEEGSGREYIEIEIAPNFKGQIYVYATDNVGNQSDAIHPSGVIVENGQHHQGEAAIAVDMPAPTYQNGEKEIFYHQDSIKIPITVTDRYAGIEKVEWQVSYKDGGSAGNQSGEIVIGNDGNPQGDNGWELKAKDANLVTEMAKTLTVAEEGNHILLNVTLTDRAGNQTVETKGFKIDRSAQEITGIKFSGTGNADSAWDSASVDKTDYGYYFKEKTEVTVQAIDASSGVKSVTYRLVGIDGTQREETQNVNANNEVTFTIAANFKGQVYVYATDYVGNACRELQTDGVIVESEGQHKQTAEVAIDMPQTPFQDAQGRRLYNKDTDIEVSVSDAYAGLRKIEWSVSSGMDKANNQSGTLEVNKDGSLSGDSNGWAINGRDANLITELGRVVTVRSNSNEITLQVKLTDRAGHTTEKKEVFSIDKTAPKISVSYDQEESPGTSVDSRYKEFYGKERKAVVTVEERNFDEGKAEIYLKKAFINADVEISGWTSKDKLGGVSDKAKYTCTVAFLGSSAYNFSAHVTDLAGLEKAYHTDGSADIFMVDKGRPSLKKDNFKISPRDRDTVKRYVDGQGVAWYNQNVDFSFTAKDICSGLYQVSAIANTMGGLSGKFSKDIKETYALENYSVQETDYGKRGETEEQGYTLTTATGRNKSEKYRLSVEAMDYAGNQSAMQSKIVGIDREKPKITGIAFEGVGNQDSSWKDKTSVDSTDYGYYFRETATVKITATDVNANGSSGLKSISYRLEDITDKDEREFVTPRLQTQEGQQYITFVVPEGFKGQIYAYATDYVGNQGNTEQPDGAIKESAGQKAEARIEVASPETSYQDAEGRPLYARDTTFHITAEDVHSGLRRVEWSVESAEDSGSNQSGFVDIDNSGAINDGSWKISGRDENLLTRLERDVTVRNNSNNITLKVKLTDRAGNVTEYNEGRGLVFSIDKTQPQINVTYLENDASHEKYYNKDRTAVITVTERNFDEEATNRQIQITNTDGSIPAYGAWSHGGESGTDRATHTCTITYAADGDYTFTMTATDKAQNSAAYGNVDEFTVDQTKPEINVSYNTADMNGIYYKDECVATVTVKEHNFDDASVTFTQTAQLDGQTIATPASGAWSSHGDVHTAVIHYDRDGDYTLSVACQDMASNEAENYSGTKFVVDTTEPKIEIVNVEDMSAYNGTVAPGVTFSDINCDAQSVKITLDGYKHEPQDLTGSLSRETHGGSVQLEDFAHTTEMDDVYTLKAQVTDLAGNSSEVSKVFSVNRYGSNYILSDGTERLVKDYYANQEEDLVIHEVNVSSLETEGITCSRDGELMKLEEGKGYDVKDEGTEYASWKEYTYTVYADNFADEGSYMVTVLSTDTAKNSMTNRTAKAKEYTKEVEFVIDKTAPTSVISGVEDNSQYVEAEHEVKIDSQDNIAIDSVEVYMNDKGTPVVAWDQQQLMENDGIMSHTLKADPHWQNLRVVAVDKAGNRSESDTIRCLLTTNILVQYYNNRILFFGSLIALATAVVLGYWFLFLKRKKQKQEETK